MSDKWPETCNEVPILKFEDREVHLYQAAFPTFGGSMGVRLLQLGEPYFYEQIKGHFLYPPARAFANPPTASEGAHVPNPQALAAVTSAGKEILYLSNEESKKPSKKKKNVITIDAEATNKKGKSSRATDGASDKGTLQFRQSNLEDYIVASDSLEGLSRIGEKKTSAAGSKSSGSAGSRISEAGATPSSIALDEEKEEEEEHEEPAAQLVSRERSREETAAGIQAAQKAGGVPVIGKQSKLCSLYKFSPEALKKTPEKTKGVEFKDPKEPAPKETKFLIKSSKIAPKEPEKVVEKLIENVVEKPTGDKSKGIETAATTAQDKTQGLETAHRDATTVAGGAGAGGSGSTAGAFAAGQAGAGSQGSMPQAPIGPKDTLGDIYYKTYTEEARSDAPHQPIWGLKQKDTFMEFAACRDWYLGSFPPGEVNRQRARTHDGLYRAYIVVEANTRAANHQIVREWLTMVRERMDWESTVSAC
ncbi:hypothetical protein Hanom_Chr01g00027921 [Helianthus anomalus]